MEPGNYAQNEASILSVLCAASQGTEDVEVDAAFAEGANQVECCGTVKFVAWPHVLQDLYLPTKVEPARSRICKARRFLTVCRMASEVQIPSDVKDSHDLASVLNMWSLQVPWVEIAALQVQSFHRITGLHQQNYTYHTRVPGSYGPLVGVDMQRRL